MAANRKVLSIDNNAHLIAKAKSRLEGAGIDVKILHADSFDLSPEDIAAIKDFAPKGIVGWFIGSHPDDVDKRTPPSTSMDKKSKQYRENIADLIVSTALCLKSVEWISAAARTGSSFVCTYVINMVTVLCAIRAIPILMGKPELAMSVAARWRMPCVPTCGTFARSRMRRQPLV